MRLEDLGYTDLIEKYRIANALTDYEPGRVVEEHKERYKVLTTTGEYEAEILGNMRFTAKSREDFPAVGDWVALTTYDADFAIIHKILPRYSVIKRQAVGQPGEVQVIATNIDYAFIVQAIDRDFNINRLERYLTICHSSKVSPIILLSKIDLIQQDQLAEIMEQLKNRIRNVPVFAVSNETQEGYQAINAVIEKGKTYCILGSSGVGKSTLLNNLSGRPVMRTDTISGSTNRGKHVTTHRELIVLENGGILIDNPGMREVGIAGSTGGLEITFGRIVELSRYCKLKDFTHINETGCSVIHALEKGEIDKASYENYMKMEREKEHFESTVEERHRKDKEFGKFIKNYKMDLKKNKY